jgi:hypothetical protein
VSICSRATLTKCPERSGLEEERALVLAGDGRHQQFAFAASQLNALATARWPTLNLRS